MKRCAPESALAALEQALGMPVITCAATWRSDLAVDLDEAAARVVVDHLEDDEFLGESVALFLLGRGGTVGFSDLIYRASRRIDLHVVVPYLVTGRVGLAALTGSSVRLGRYGAVGAYDAAGAHPSLEHDASASRSLLARVLTVDPDATHSLSLTRLGAGQGLVAAELEAMGATAHDLESAADRATWELFTTYEEALGLREGSRRRYTESDVGDEVEWEFATGVLGAVVESRRSASLYMLDTGAPDPETGRLQGAWTKGEVESSLELDFDNATPVE